MQKHKCGLCGFEFENGMAICQGCQGEISYGAGGMAIFFGVVYAAIFYFVVYNMLVIEFETFWGVGIAFVGGFIHAMHLFKDSVQTTKKTPS